MLVGIQRDAVVMRQRGEFFADAGQARCIRIGIAVEFELEIAGAGIFACIGDAAGALDPVIEADGMPDRDTLEPPAPRQKLRDVVVRKIRRQPRIDACDISRHARRRN